MRAPLVTLQRNPGLDLEEERARSSSIDVSLKKITGAGGKVVTPKTPIPGMGAFARVADTEGNVLGLFQMG